MGLERYPGRDRLDRLPAHRCAQTDEKMHGLATHPSGVHIDFAGAPERIYVRWTMSDQRPSETIRK